MKRTLLFVLVFVLVCSLGMQSIAFAADVPAELPEVVEETPVPQESPEPEILLPDVEIPAEEEAVTQVVEEEQVAEDASEQIPQTDQLTYEQQFEQARTGEATVQAKLPIPENFTANRTGTSVHLSWNAVPGAEGYVIYYYTPSSSSTFLTQVYSRYTTSYTHYSADVNTTYTYQIAAYVGRDLGEITSTTSPGQRDSSPAPPQNVRATAGAGKVSLSWSSVSGAVDEYVIFRGLTESTVYTIVQRVPSTSSSYVDTDVVSGKTYYYRICATRGGTLGYPSNCVSAYVFQGVTLIPPSNVTVKSIAYNKILLEWNEVAGADYYEAWVCETPTPSYPGLAISNVKKGNYSINANGRCSTYLKGDILIGRKCYISMRTVVGTKASGFSTVVPITAQVAKPTSLKATAQTGQKVKLTWVRSEGASGYLVYRSTSKTSGFKLVKTLTNVASYTDANLTAKKVYYYKVIPYRSVSGKKVNGAAAGPVAVRAK